MLARPELFDALYSVIDLDTPVLIERFMRLRFSVYCVENSWLNPQDYPDGVERDAFDVHSVQIGLVHRGSGDMVGGVRLILPTEGAGINSFPIGSVVPATTRTLLAGLPLHRTAEVSRFAISKAFRQKVLARQPGVRSKDGRAADLERMLMPYATLGLMRGIERHARRHGITHLCAEMEPALMRLLARMGLRFVPVGAPVNYYGLRQPCVMEIAPSRATVREASAFGYAVIHAAPNPAAAMAVPAATARRNAPYETGVEAAA